MLFIILSKSTSLTYSVSFFLWWLCLESLLFLLLLMLLILLSLWFPTTISDSTYDSKNLFFFFIILGFAYVLLIMSAGLNLLFDFVGDFLLRFVYDLCWAARLFIFVGFILWPNSLDVRSWNTELVNGKLGIYSLYGSSMFTRMFYGYFFYKVLGIWSSSDVSNFFSPESNIFAVIFFFLPLSIYFILLFNVWLSPFAGVLVFLVLLNELISVSKLFYILLLPALGL